MEDRPGFAGSALLMIASEGRPSADRQCRGVKNPAVSHYMISLISSFFPAGKKARPTTGRLTQSLRKERVPTNNKTRPNSLPTFADQRLVTNQTRRSPSKEGERARATTAEFGPPKFVFRWPNITAVPRLFVSPESCRNCGHNYNVFAEYGKPHTSGEKGGRRNSR